MPHTRESRKRSPETRAKIAAALRGNRNAASGGEYRVAMTVSVAARTRKKIETLAKRKGVRIGAVIDEIFEQID